MTELSRRLFLGAGAALAVAGPALAKAPIAEPATAVIDIETAGGISYALIGGNGEVLTRGMLKNWGEAINWVADRSTMLTALELGDEEHPSITHYFGLPVTTGCLASINVERPQLPVWATMMELKR